MATKPERSAKLDNVKGFLIILTVFAHLISSLLKWGEPIMQCRSR